MAASSDDQAHAESEFWTSSPVSRRHEEKACAESTQLLTERDCARTLDISEEYMFDSTPLDMHDVTRVWWWSCRTERCGSTGSGSSGRGFRLDCRFSADTLAFPFGCLG